MARYSSTNSSGNLFAVLVALLAIGLFTAIVMWPSSSPTKIVSSGLPDTQLTQALNDPETHQYLTALHRVKPKVANRLQERADAAIADGASDDELAALILETYSTAVEDDVKYLVSADVKHFNKILQMSQRGLSTLSSKAPKYCRPASYMRFSDMEPEEIAYEMSGLFGYGSEGYDWVLRFNVVVLEAIEAGRDNPQKYQRLSSGDQMAIQNTMMKMMSNPQVSRLMQLQGRSEAEQKRAAMTMNFCGLGSDLLAAVNGLPTDTKSRLLGELQHQARSGDFERLLSTVQSRI
ncbi:MAG: hypothetical protein Hens2KO_08080 [Henriciella sp.]